MVGKFNISTHCLKVKVSLRLVPHYPSPVASSKVSIYLHMI